MSAVSAAGVSASARASPAAHGPMRAGARALRRAPAVRIGRSQVVTRAGRRGSNAQEAAPAPVAEVSPLPQEIPMSPPPQQQQYYLPPPSGYVPPPPRACPIPKTLNPNP
jgi:hypothetical protein